MSTSSIPDGGDAARRSKEKRLGNTMRSYTGRTINGLRHIGLLIADVKTDLDSNVDASANLFKHAHAIRERVQKLERPPDARLSADLKAVLDDIFNFEKKVGKTSEARHIALANDYRAKIDSYRERLDRAWSLCQAERLDHVEETVQRSQSDERPQQSSAPIPIDQLLPILPTFLAIYVGHEDDVKALVRILVDVLSAHVIIMGGGGMGKTALATKGMHDPEVESKFGNLRFFIHCDGVVSAEAIAAAIAAVFKVTKSSGAALQQVLLAYLRSLHTPMLIVLDNLDSAWDTDDQTSVESFLSNLCSVDHLAVVVTMRGTGPPQGIVWHQKTILKPLESQDSRTLFKQLSPECTSAAEEPYLAELLDSLDGLPLAITLLASVSLTGYRVSDLLKAYRDERTSMLKRGRAKDRLTSLDISIQVSMHCQTMRENPDALTLLELLSLLPDGLHEEERNAVLPSMSTCASAARVLVQVALCTRKDGIHRVLAPIREYIQVHHPPSGPHLKELRRYHFRLAHRARDWPAREPLVVLNEVGPKVANILAVVRHATETMPHATEPLSALLDMSYFSRNTDIGDCKPYLQAVLTAYPNIDNSQSKIRTLLAKCRLVADSRTKRQALVVHCRLALGRTLRYQRDLDGATAVFKEAQRMFDDIRDRYGAAKCTHALSSVLLLQQDYEAATMGLKEAKEAYKGLRNGFGVAHCMQLLGRIMLRQGAYEDATTALLEAKNAFEIVGDSWGTAWCTGYLGKIMCKQRNHEGATAALQESQAVHESIGHRFGVAWCTGGIGQIMKAQGDYDGATAALKAAKVIFDDIGDRLDAAWCARTLGETMHVQGDYDGATAALREAKAAYEGLGYVGSGAWCSYTIGQVLQEQHDYDSATRALEEAKSVYENAGDRRGVARCARCLGEIMDVQGNYDGAKAALNQAKAAFTELGESYDATRCLYKLGTIMQNHGDYDAAIAAMEEAKATYEKLGKDRGAAKCTRRLDEISKSQRTNPVPADVAEPV